MLCDESSIQHKPSTAVWSASPGVVGSPKTLRCIIEVLWSCRSGLYTLLGKTFEIIGTKIYGNSMILARYRNHMWHHVTTLGHKSKDIERKRQWSNRMSGVFTSSIHGPVAGPESKEKPRKAPKRSAVGLPKGKADWCLKIIWIHP